MTAADELLRRLDQWASHVRACQADECGLCQVLFNQLLLAHTVWSNVGLVDTLDDPIDEDWLREAGFKWHQFDRQPSKHWLLWLGNAIGGMTSFEDIGIEVAAGAWNPETGLDDEWFCWLRGDSAGRYHRFIHLRHLRSRRELIRIVEAITSQPWNTANHLYGGVHTPDQVRRIRAAEARADRRGPSPAWSEVEKDDTRGRALPEHLEVAEHVRTKATEG